MPDVTSSSRDPGDRGETGPARSSADSDDSGADLREALDRLAHLTLGGRSLESSLQRIATLTVLAIPGAQGAGVAMLETNHPETVCVSDPFVQQVDDIQYQLGEGPCITAAAEARIVTSGSLESDPAWPKFARRVQRLGVHSVVALPLVLVEGEVVGALNVYARGRDAFTTEAVGLGGAFALAAAVTVSNARDLMQARRLSDNLRAALTSRASIDHAIGIIMSRRGGTVDDAFGVLRELSQRQNVKLSVVAEGFVHEAVTRARARHAEE